MVYPDMRSRRLVLASAFAISSLAADGFAGGLPKNTGSASIARTTDAAATPRIFAIRPISGPAAGGTAVSIYGLRFAAGAAVEIGGVAATGIALAGATRIDAVAPALPAGSVSDVVVTVPGQTPVILRAAWFARFGDVTPAYLFVRPIEKLRRKGITTGCGGGNYCPEDSVTRAQMAVFILRGKHGSSYRPPPATGTVFDDVPKTALFADWMEEFAAEGITTGCGGKNYCPNNSVTRGEMAVFLLRAKHGSAHNPPPPIGFFGDVTKTTPFAKWIEELAGEAITTGCGSGNYCPTGPSTRGQMAVFLTKTFARNPQEVIKDDLAAGDIDYETSLLYRFYALFSDSRLPARYDSAPSDGEDPGLYEEVDRVFSTLSAAGQAALAPFLARPDEPESPFGAAGSPLAARRPDETASSCPTFWVGTSAPGSHFKIHLCASDDETADNALRNGVNTIADGLWGPMTADVPAGMGPPLGDCYTPSGGSETCPGGDEKIDVYIVEVAQCHDRNGQCWPLSATGVARAVSALPHFGKRKSGYMLLAKARASSAATIKSDFAHEFFHVLQFSWNYDAMGEDTGIEIGGERAINNMWFVESSATWAEWNFVPATAPAEVHWRFADDFQPSHESLLATFPSDHRYASYIWSFFGQQETSSPGVVHQAWADAESASSPEGITDAVDQQLDFETHFRDFAVRNFNVDLPGHPIHPLYKDAASGFPNDVPPTFVNQLKVTNAGERKQKPHVNPDSLSAQYDQIEVDENVKKIILRFSKLPSQIDVDLLVGVLPDKWELKRVSKTDPVVFCREVAAEKVFKIIVILSNHSKEAGAFASGDYEIERRASCCSDIGEATKVEARVSFGYTHTGEFNGNAVHLSDSATLTATLYPDTNGLPFSIGFFMDPPGTLPGGTAELHDSIEYPSSTTNLDGSGAPYGNSGIGLTVDLENCTCAFVGTAFLPNKVTPGDYAGPNAAGYARGAGISVKDFADTISGGKAFPAHSEIWGITHLDESYYISGGYGYLISTNPANEDNMGAANVTYSFTVEIPESSVEAKPNR